MQEWGINDLWRWTFSMERTVLLGLALMLTYVLLTFFIVCWQFDSARHAEVADFADRRFRRKRKALVAKLSVWIRQLKAMGVTAPYLGVAGTILGILDTLSGGSMGPYPSAFAALASGANATLLSTAAGLIVAVPAIASYNYLRARLETLQKEISKDAAHRSSHFHASQRLPLCARFSAIAVAPAAAIFIVAFVLPWSFGPPAGLAIGVAPANCELVGDRPIVLHITEAGRLLINSEEADWENLEFRLSLVYRPRSRRILYLLADDGVPFQSAADAIEIAENAREDVGQKTSEKLGISVQLLTPEVLAACHAHPTPTRSDRLAR